MPGEKQIRATVSQAGHRHFSPTDQFAFLVPFGKFKRVVCYYRLYYLVGCAIQLFPNACDLILIDPSTLYRQRTRRIDAYDDDFLVGIRRLKITGDMAAVLIERL